MDKSDTWPRFTQWLNVAWTKLSRETMRMSAEPKNIFEFLIAALVNTCRILFNNAYVVIFFILIAWILVRNIAFSKRKGIIKR